MASRFGFICLSWHITLKQLNRCTLIDTFSCFGGPEVTLWTGMRDVPGLIPSSCKDFYVYCFVLLLMCFNSFVKQIIINITFCFIAMLIHLVYVTYCTICDRLLRYQDTNLASLRSRRCSTRSCKPSFPRIIIQRWSHVCVTCLIDMEIQCICCVDRRTNVHTQFN